MTMADVAVAVLTLTPVTDSNTPSTPERAIGATASPRMARKTTTGETSVATASDAFRSLSKKIISRVRSLNTEATEELAAPTLEVSPQPVPQQGVAALPSSSPAQSVNPFSSSSTANPFSTGSDDVAATDNPFAATNESVAVAIESQADQHKGVPESPKHSTTAHTLATPATPVTPGSPKAPPRRVKIKEPSPAEQRTLSARRESVSRTKAAAAAAAPVDDDRNITTPTSARPRSQSAKMVRGASTNAITKTPTTPRTPTTPATPASTPSSTPQHTPQHGVTSPLANHGLPSTPESEESGYRHRAVSMSARVTVRKPTPAKTTPAKK